MKIAQNIMRWLQFLKTYNPNYRNIDFSMTNMEEIQSNIYNILPELNPCAISTDTNSNEMDESIVLCGCMWI